MSEQYYLRINGQNLGPLTKEALLAHAPTLETPVWHPGLPEWTTVGKVPELAALLAPVPPSFAEASGSPVPPVPPAFEVPNETNAGAGKSQVSNRTLMLLGLGLLVVIGVLIFLLNRNPAGGGSSSGSMPTDSMEAAAGRGSPPDPAAADVPVIDGQDDEKARIAALTAKNMEYRNNWARYITASRSEFTTSGVGGVYGLSITVANETEYPLDYVWVAVDYITVNGYRHKREILTFEEIKPRTRQALYAPDSDRGSRVSYEIISIGASAFKFCYDAGSVGNGSTVDPWKCAN